MFAGVLRGAGRAHGAHVDCAKPGAEVEAVDVAILVLVSGWQSCVEGAEPCSEVEAVEFVVLVDVGEARGGRGRDDGDGVEFVSGTLATAPRI